MTIFDNKDAFLLFIQSEIPHYCAYTLKATITPTTIYFSSPTVEITNQVLRHYARENREGRFLRVQFTDEMAEVGWPLPVLCSTINIFRDVSIRVLTHSEMMSYLSASTEHCSMAFELETASINSWRLATLSSVRMGHISFAQPTTCLVTISVSGWATSHI